MKRIQLNESLCNPQHGVWQVSLLREGRSSIVWQFDIYNFLGESEGEDFSQEMFLDPLIIITNDIPIDKLREL